ncbi:hypothetical protein HAX54_033621 [Datura stramonium]|uniref:Uncharacterized protein n=1 Tax=Datura stramonium TaxID=4076 RepID=A0ABS8VFR9_DATST|nr:hypothetical protein [Datura stramonium]
MEKVTECHLDDGSSPSFSLVGFTGCLLVKHDGSDEGDDSSANKSSLGGAGFDLDGDSGNKATSSLTWDFEEMFSRLPEYPEIEEKYKFYDLGWMTEALGYYYPTTTREFYANYIATMEVLCKKGQKPIEMLIQLHILVRGEMVDISEATIIRGDNTLAEERVVLRASLMYGFPLNMEAIIAEEINWRVVKFPTSLPFPSLIARLCKEAYVPILAGIDVETYAIKKYDLAKSKDETRYDLKLHKPIPKVFESSGKSAKEAETTTDPAGVATEMELVCYAALIPISSGAVAVIESRIS